MKSGKPLITFVMTMLAVSLLCYLGYYAWTTFRDPFTTTYAYTYQLNDSVEVEGLVVRSEYLLPGRQGIVDVTRGEGEQVGVGQTVALVYQDDQARLAQQEQDSLRTEIIQLQYAMGQEGDVASAAKVDDDILSGLIQLRGDCGVGQYGDLEDQVLQVKSSVLRREYTYGTDLTADDLALRLSELRQRYTDLQNQTYATVSQITTPVSGTFSSQTDGFETLVSPETVVQLTPTALESLLHQAPTADQGAAGKIITSNQWYFAAVMTADQAKRLEDQDSITLRFASDFVENIPANLYHIGAEENGKVVVVVSTNRCLEETTLLRLQSAQLIFDTQTGIRVPKAALRMETRESTDEETGETTQTSQSGVYVITAGKAEFKAVEILGEGDDFYVVRSLNQEKKALRAGDEVIIHATDLYDGKLLEY